MHKTNNTKKELLSWPRKTIYLKELIKIIGLEKKDDYTNFYNRVMGLVKEGLLTPIQKSGFNGMNPRLVNRYRVIFHNLPDVEELKAELLRLNPKLNIDYYQNHIDDYIKDRKTILVFDSFFSQGRFPEKIERRELSFKLFNLEKALDDSTQAFKVMKRLGLTLERDFNCFDRRLPVTFYPFSERVQRVLIIENLTPFYDLYLILRNLNRQEESIEHLIPFDGIAFGNGNHIIASFEFFYDIFNDVRALDFYYWGDVDGAGLNIYALLKLKFPEFKISLWEEAYEKMLNIGQYRRDMTKLTHTSEHLRERVFQLLKEYVKAGRAIPQEALDYTMLEELIHDKRFD